MKPVISITIALFILMIFPGCNETNKSKTVNVKIEQISSNRNIEVIDSVKLSGLINNRKGKLLFLNIWATWCLPCIEEFPELITLSETFKNHKIEVVGISIDYPDEIETKILPFLKKRNVPFKVYVANFNNDEDLINMLDKKWSGAIPATFLFDAKGKKQFTLIGQRKYEEFKKEVESFLVM